MYTKFILWSPLVFSLSVLQDITLPYGTYLMGRDSIAPMSTMSVCRNGEISQYVKQLQIHHNKIPVPAVQREGLSCRNPEYSIEYSFILPYFVRFKRPCPNWLHLEYMLQAYHRLSTVVSQQPMCKALCNIVLKGALWIKFTYLLKRQT